MHTHYFAHQPYYALYFHISINTRYHVGTSLFEYLVVQLHFKGCITLYKYLWCDIFDGH